MSFASPPATAAWQHCDARTGFEVVTIVRLGDGWRLRGATTAVEDERPWAVDYAIDVDDQWRTRRARVSRPLDEGSTALTVRQVGEGRWLVDGRRVPELDGCLDIDLESSAMTNALPVHRLGLAVGQTADVPAVYVRAADLGVDRLGQTYSRLTDSAEGQCHDYTAPAFDFTARLVYDDSGFVVEYPGLAVRRA
ncbi:putative glycolipid-binding domain-containing protein [Yinghuangia sp. YIM S10712]|uniref:putative glycolipid-binding domain-containing protein n=1 Tax=Yinghuangia sp. YIM S10712 TaxID=3436930 RepID=UPI003F532D72